MCGLACGGHGLQRQLVAAKSGREAVTSSVWVHAQCYLCPCWRGYGRRRLGLWVYR